MSRHRKRFRVLFCLAAAGAYGQVAAWGESAPVVDASASSQRLEGLQRKPANQRPIVTIYQFRSGMTYIGGDAATDMFTTALIKSGAFLVAERQRLNQDLLTEKRLNQQGLTNGDTATKQMAGARYIFEGTISEYNAGQSETGGGFSVGGMQIGGNHSTDSIGIDVRVLDADTGLVVDSVNLRKEIAAGGGGVSGVGSLAQSIAGMRGHSIPLDVDAQVSHSEREGVDTALRACIEGAVYELVKRYGSGS